MICELCNQNNATLHLTSIINGQKIERNVCTQCALKHGMNGMGFNIGNLFGSFVKMPQEKTKSLYSCPECGMDLERFRENGRLGCTQCYEALREPLIPILEGIHGKCRHKGTVPEHMEKEFEEIQKMDLLRNELQECITMENYERAAQIRDEMRALSGEV